MFSMRYLGGEDGPAPRLHDVRLEDPEPFLAAVLQGIESLARAGVVHGDLSAFNILVHEGEPWWIDFSEAFRIDRVGTSSWIRLTEATEALRHGMQALAGYFRRYGLALDPEPFIARLVDSHDKFGVLR
jgi:RIO kinase 1